MTPSPSDSPAIPVEIVSDEEMAVIDAALRSSLSSSSPMSAVFSPSHSSLFSSPSSSRFQQNSRSIRSINTLRSKKRLWDGMESNLVGDIEDFHYSGDFRRPQKRERVMSESLFRRFRWKKGLAVTDITATEWCEKQMEFTLLFGKPESTESMEDAGCDSHAELEQEVYFYIQNIYHPLPGSKIKH